MKRDAIFTILIVLSLQGTNGLAAGREAKALNPPTATSKKNPSATRGTAKGSEKMIRQTEMNKEFCDLVKVGNEKAIRESVKKGQALTVLTSKTHTAYFMLSRTLSRLRQYDF
jgi:hypothetical protein